MKFLVIDDEYSGRSELKYLISNYQPEVEIDEADSSEKAMELIAECCYDAAFVDIHLGDGIGTSLAVMMRNRQPELKIVFATAYDSYAVKAFEVEAVDYIMKPFDPVRVGSCLKKLKTALLTSTNTETKKQDLPSNKLTVPLDKRVVILDVKEIAYLESKERHCVVYTKSGEYHSSLALGYYEKKLLNHSFFRIHKSFLINLDFLFEVTPWVNGAFNVRLTGLENRVLPVSRKQAKLLKEIIEG